MKRPIATAVAGISVALLAGCGSSSKSSSTAASSPPTTSTPSAAPAVVITSKQTKLGTILGGGPKRLTVYLFEGDKGSSSSCSGECATVWPPVTGQPQAGGAADSSQLGTISGAIQDGLTVELAVPVNA